MALINRRGRSIAAALSVALLLGACTTTSTVRLSADQSIITTRGNAFTTPEKVYHDLLLQAATQTQAAGYEWFVVVSERDVTRSGVAYFPAEGSASASGNASAWSGSASYTGAQVIPFTKPGEMVLVKFGRGPRPPQAFVAADLIALNVAKAH